MASLRLTFPEKDQPTVIALTGARLTIGRLPFNTIQIIDRTVSGFHAELISEHGHYRLHDRGSSNGTYVNGQKVSDYHLNEACTISFGTVEVQFNPADVATDEEAETFPSRGEVNAVRQENVEMKATVEALREEINALREAHAAPGESVSAAVSRVEYERVVVEREALKEAQLRQEEEVTRLKTDLAILKRDRLNLQLAYDAAQRDLEQLQRKVNGADDEPALPPVEAAAIVAAQAGEVRIEVPKSAAAAVPTVASPAPSVEAPSLAETPASETGESGSPLAPAAAAAPLNKPFIPPPSALPKAPGSLGQMPKPGVPVSMPKSTPLPPKSPAAMPGSGLRPVARPSIAPGTAKTSGEAAPGSPATASTQRLAHRPLPPPRQIPQATTRLNPDAEPKAGPKGTQKLSE